MDELAHAEKIRLLARKGMGWKYSTEDIPELSDGALIFREATMVDGARVTAKRGNTTAIYIWNPFASLDQCAEIEARLTDGQWSRYIEALRHLAAGEKVYLHNSWSRFLVELSAAQRSEALVEVLNA